MNSCFHYSYEEKNITNMIKDGMYSSLFSALTSTLIAITLNLMFIIFPDVQVIDFLKTSVANQYSIHIYTI